MTSSHDQDDQDEQPCDTCTTYLRNRIHVLGAAIDRRITTPWGHTTALHRYMLKVHRRHLAGGTLETLTTDAAGNALP